MKKKAKAPTGPRCTSTVSGGVLKCVLEGKHEVHSTTPAGRNRKGQYATWSTTEDGRIHVITFSGGKRQSDWYEDAPPAAKATAKCQDKMAGIVCILPKGHRCDHAGDGGTWSRDRKRAHFDCKPDPREDDEDPFEDEVRSDEDREFARKMREDREAHMRALDAEPERFCGYCQSPVDDDGQCASCLSGRTPIEIERDRSDLSAIKVHPAADVFPMHDGPEYEELREDIRRNGVRVRPVIDSDGLLVDGRNRVRACAELGLKVEFDSLPPDIDPLDFVISANIKRRHLSASQKAMFAEAVANLRPGRPNKSGSTAGLTQAQAAERFGVSERSIREARIVREHAAPEVIDAVQQGKLSVDAAAKLAQLPKAKQKAIYEREIKPKKTMVKGGKIKTLAKQEEKRAVIRKINEQRVAPMPVGAFGVIYADYPWPYDNSDQHDGSRGHLTYPPMKMDDILAHAREAAKRAAKDAIVALWTTNLHLANGNAARLVEAYGATPHTIVTWPKPRAGVGTWPRGQTEHLVIASIGEPVHTLNEITTLLPSWQPERPREHSSKPKEVAELLVKHCAGPFLELFARAERDGWECWGAEVEKFSKEASVLPRAEVRR